MSLKPMPLTPSGPRLVDRDRAVGVQDVGVCRRPRVLPVVLVTLGHDHVDRLVEEATERALAR